eukprot:TRINITY_DN6917_c0_g1_i1.p1 TRINITY_DN6917_c0_g1~~TRINITY_DN6917_c0_g1_i1.p1  ORF type:complete len:942 (-),score=196.83 TRINITY_DN6917_c0_g1_i1:743-3568(-)
MLEIEVVEAHGLMGKDEDGFSDPYCKIRVEDVKFRTEPILDTVDPMWGETFHVNFQSLQSEILFELFDYDKRGKDKFLGQVKIMVHEAVEERIDQWFELEKRSKKSRVSGRLHLRINFRAEQVKKAFSKEVLEYFYVKFIGAQGLKQKEGVNYYAKGYIPYYEETQEYQTSSSPGPEPSWEEKVKFKLDGETENLQVQLFQSGSKDDKMIGCVQINASHARSKDLNFSEWFFMKKNPKDKRVNEKIGQIHLGVYVGDLGSNSRGVTARTLENRKSNHILKNIPLVKDLGSMVTKEEKIIYKYYVHIKDLECFERNVNDIVLSFYMDKETYSTSPKLPQDSWQDSFAMIASSKSELKVKLYESSNPNVILCSGKIDAGDYCHSSPGSTPDWHELKSSQSGKRPSRVLLSIGAELNTDMQSCDNMGSVGLIDIRLNSAEGFTETNIHLCFTTGETEYETELISNTNTDFDLHEHFRIPLDHVDEELKVIAYRKKNRINQKISQTKIPITSLKKDKYELESIHLDDVGIINISYELISNSSNPEMLAAKEMPRSNMEDSKLVPIGKVIVNVIEAENLLNVKDQTPVLVRVKCGKFEIDSIPKELEDGTVKWRDRVTLNIYDQKKDISLSVIEKEKGTKLGTTTVPVSRVTRQEFDSWVDIQKKPPKLSTGPPKYAGSIHIQMRYIQEDLEEKSTDITAISLDMESESDADYLFSERNVTRESGLKNVDSQIKVIVVGDAGVGKSNLLSSWLTGTSKEQAPTISPESFSKTYKIEDQTVKVNCWDTAGQERFKSITRQYYRGTMGAIAVYDVTDYSTFENCAQWLEEIKEECKEDVLILLVGNKSDLELERSVPTNVATKYARENGLFFLETSAKTGSNVRKAFRIILEEIYQQTKRVVNTRNQRHSTTIPRGTTIPNPTQKKTIILTNDESTDASKSDQECLCG